jgi:hypothetical protein
MIIELTKENLQKCGFEEEQIIKLLKWDKYDMFFLKDTCYYATNIEKKIFTEIDGFRKYYLENGTISFPLDCPDLIPNYFDLALKNYLDKQILLLNTMFVEEDQRKKFVLNEIEKIKSSIEVLKEDIKIKIYLIRDNKKKQVDILDSYLNFLKNKLDEQPQQSEIIKVLEVKKELHNNIFTDNAFYVWQRLFENFNITGTQRTDLRFMYEVMLYNGQIHKTVTVKNITDWINETYDFDIDKLQFTDIKGKSNEKRMSVYNLIK